MHEFKALNYFQGLGEWKTIEEKILTIHVYIVYIYIYMFKLDKMLNFRELFYLHAFFKQRKVFVNVNYIFFQLGNQ